MDFGLEQTGRVLERKVARVLLLASRMRLSVVERLQRWPLALTLAPFGCVAY
jgi:hypothetical protein